MNIPELKSRIEKKNIENIYLFSGPEIGEKKKIIEILEKKIFGENDPIRFNIYINNDLEPKELIDAIESELLFSSEKIIYIKNIEQINQKIIKVIEGIIIPKRLDKNSYDKIVNNTKGGSDEISLIKKNYVFDEVKEVYQLQNNIKDAEKKKIISFFNKIKHRVIAEGTYIVMLNETNDKIPAGLLNLLSPDQYIIFWEMFENQKFSWIREEFKKHNLYIEDNAINFILDTIENNKFEFETEIERISNYYKNSDNKNNVVNKDTIESYIYHSKDETAFSLYSALLEKNVEKALNILDKIFYVEAEGIVSGLIWSHRRFLKVLDLIENERMPTEQAFDKMFIKMKKIRDEMGVGIRNYSFYKMSLLTHYLVELEYYSRFLPQELKRIKYQEFIINFVYGKNHISFWQGKNQYLLS